MTKAARKKARARKPTRGLKFAKWLVAVGAVALVVYALTQMSGVAFSDRDIKVVDFSNLSAGAKHRALVAANEARCPCGCGMTVAQCVATDSTCPIREQNVERIKTMVRNAESP